MRSVCVFCGSNFGAGEAYSEAARGMGRVLAARGLRLVYGGAKAGLMGVLADSALAAGGEVVGIIPAALVEREIAHPGLTELRTVASMHERKAAMSDLADAFVALPGGAGTLEELFEVWTWGQLGYHQKPVGLLNAAGFFDRLLAFFDHQAAERFMRPAHRDMLVVESDPDALLDRFARYQAPNVPKWIERDER
ncbi:TIGR00730 family Rossman fold protein [Propylenella binzhouense]|uniref:Cytokinin riboside 5'-monophosphate phosphoribohydrolase n=1 Tax=Propylenella binzhouense TaxID=2555902 RepID=A0A964WTV4_9HYPH|nr:TIGR00730 family Rossman fold protein [Propylenella binzhouense]MYZ48394.1 TIGR00730 family Rossman fold protein [Propylenella binzhouense]